MGKIAVIMGGGATLADMPLWLLEKYPSYGTNFITIQPTYYVSVDSRVLTERAADVYPVAEKAEIAYLSALHGDENEETRRLYALPNVKRVSKDRDAFSREVYMSGFTGTYVALKLAFYAGFDTVYLWGVDHDAMWAHYRPDYPPDLTKSLQERLERMKVMRWHFALANDVYNAAGRLILNFSAHSKLDDIFRRGNPNLI